MVFKGFPVTLVFGFIFLDLVLLPVMATDYVIRPGGTGSLQEADAHVQNLVDKVKENLEAKTGNKYVVFTAVSYKTQVVAGTNYFVKVQVGPNSNDFIHLRIWEKLPHVGGEELTSFLVDMTKEAPIEYF